MTDKDYIVTTLKKKAVKTIMLKIFGRVVGGPVGYLVTLLVEKIFEHGIEPLVNELILRDLLLYDRKKGKVLVRKIQKAKDENNESNYRDLISGV